MTAERSIREHQREASAAKNAFSDELERRRLLLEGWSEEALDSERRFGHRAARLYPYVSHEETGGVVTNQNAVSTPLGPGTLLRVFADAPGWPGAMVLHLRPRAWITEWNKDGTVKRRRPAADFVAVEDVKPYAKGAS